MLLLSLQAKLETIENIQRTVADYKVRTADMLRLAALAEIDTNVSVTALGRFRRMQIDNTARYPA